MGNLKQQRLQGKRVTKPSKCIELSRPPLIQVLDLSFSYSAYSNPIFTSLSFEINPGEHLGIVGQSGCGKTTLISLLSGLSKPTSGKILLDGKEPGEFFSNEENRVGYVGAESLLISGSIRENLLYGFITSGLPATPDDETLWKILKGMELYDAIRSLPGGLDYRIRETGEGLSSGQKQRLCFARSLIRKPGTLFLDEP